MDNPVHGIRLETSFAYVTSDYHVVAPTDTQFVFANVYSGLPRENLALIVDDDKYEFGVGIHPDATVLAEAEGVERLAGFAVPRDIDATDVKLVLEAGDGVETLATFDNELVEKLNNPPEFEVVSFDLPETGSVEADIPITATVRNTGGREGTFFATLERDDLTSATQYFGLTVPANGRAQWNGVKSYGPTPNRGGRNDFTYRLDWDQSSASSTITVSK